MEDCLTFLGALQYSIRAGINSKNFYCHYTYRTNENQQIPLSFYPRWGTIGARAPIFVPLNPLKAQKPVDFLRNQRLNMVAGIGLKPVASGL